MHSKHYMQIKKWYEAGYWDETRVRAAVTKGLITAEECKEILNGGE